MTDDDLGGDPTAGGSPPGEDGTGGSAGEHSTRSRPKLSADGAYALLWGAVALVAAALAFDGSVGAVVVLAGFAGGVGLYAAGNDLLRGRSPTSLEYLWMGTPALLGAGIAAFDGRLTTAGGLGVVAAAALVEGYGWFGAGTDDTDDTDDAEDRGANGKGNGGS